MILNRKRFWTIGLALMTALSVMGFSLGNLIAVHAETSTYQDPAGRFEVGIISGYKMTPLAGMFVVESPEGDLAYTVTVRPKAGDRHLEDDQLAQIAVDTLATGEGFIAGAFTGNDIGIELPWRGVQGKTPIAGMVFARQTNNSVLVLSLSTTETSTEKIAEILPELSQTLKPIE
ncbi:hypothetical protein [[Limnothrix rosea] IAM M-220]|uniref:hypothetical protein n=1 Tax=[Limnothrix rosea] IAM M-220 TaxID=454133 RepID=UPI000962F4F1|nr:hypothetical protein [[Limnothrix rosea] IAM M-220]OKH11758.1 hypothetical protein NIES208_16875 [[Limnothrix rosea] IAM M-220]